MFDVTDNQLLTRWASGDAHAGRTLVERHFGIVCRFFESKLAHDSEDLVQRTFELCLAQANEFRGEGSVRGYLLGIARRQLYTHFRARRRETTALQREEDLSVEAWTLSVSSLLEARDERDLLLRALHKIPLDEQIAIELHYWEGLSTGEIGEILGTPAGTIKYRLSHGRKHLRALIAEAQLQPDLRRSTLQGLDAWVDEVRTAVEKKLEPRSIPPRRS